MDAVLKTRFIGTFALLFFFLFSCSHVIHESPEHVQANCIHLALGIPKQSDLVDCREGYAIGYNYRLKSADWVAYRLESQSTNNGVERTNNFRVDPKIPIQYQTRPSDYEEPVYDQGHLANSASIDTSERANSASFLMSNIVPQLPGNNRAIWKGLENRERKYATELGVIYVYAGPLYLGDVESIGNNVLVPSHFWKVIYSPVNQASIAYIIEHKKLKTDQLDNYITSIDQVEAISHLDLLDALEDVREQSLESFVHPPQGRDISLSRRNLAIKK